MIKGSSYLDTTIPGYYYDQRKAIFTQWVKTFLVILAKAGIQDGHYSRIPAPDQVEDRDRGNDVPRPASFRLEQLYRVGASLRHCHFW